MLKVANSAINVSQITGVLPVVNGGTGVTTSTGTGSTVLSAAPTLSGDVTLSTGNLVIGTSGAGLTSTGAITVKSSAGGDSFQVFSSASATNPALFVYGSGTVNGIATGANGAASAMYVNKDSGSTRSINAAGTLNAAGLDYAEYMVKSGDFTVDKGDVVGVNAQGKLANVFADSISFVVKSTNPSFVGGDIWFTEPAPLEPLLEEGATDERKLEHALQFAEYGTLLAVWKQRLEAARQNVDRIAFAGQVPVNVIGATAGQYIIPVNNSGAIKGQAISNPTFEQYKTAVGKVIAVEADGRAKIIVKIA